MAAAAPLYESLLNHLTLYPRLPGHQDARIDIIERAIIERIRDATNKICSLPENPHLDALQSLRRSIETCARVNAGGRLTRISLLNAFKHLEENDMIIIHVAQQNAGLLIRRGPTNVIIEAFEASALSEEVLATKSALQWDFPGSAVALSFTDFDNPSFQEELATFLEKASRESIKRFAAHANKAGSFVYENRDTVDPALITQMLMTLLESLGTRVYVSVLRKRIRDDVSWSEGGQLPWRRCPFWLILRVGIERHLSITLGGEVGRLHYKFLVVLVLSRLLDESLRQISLEQSAFLKGKVCRRLIKIGADKGNARPELAAEYQRLFKSLIPDLEKSAQNVTEQIARGWENYKKLILRQILNLPKYADPRHLALTLPNSSPYLHHVLKESFKLGVVSQQFTSSLPKGFQPINAACKAGNAFAEKYFQLANVEARIKSNNSLARSLIRDDDHECKQVSVIIERYLDGAGDAYDQNPEQMSILILTVMELWMRMDQAANGAFPLLKEFNPAFPADILDVLQLSMYEDISRLLVIRKYLRERHVSCKGNRMTIFTDPVTGCFAERYYNESPDSARLETLHAMIEANALNARNVKVQEWQDKTAAYQALIQEASEAVCICDVDDYGRRNRNRKCDKCFLDRKVDNFSMAALEHPLPADPVHARVVVFELACPPAFSAYRDLTWRILSGLALPREFESHVPKLFLIGYKELMLYHQLKPSRFSMASKTKSFLQTHYRRQKFPVDLGDICLPNGLKLGYWDEGLKSWAARLTQRPSFASHCQLVLPTNSPFEFLNSSPAFAADSKGPTTYEVISTQSKCPPGLNVHEHLSFQALFSGRSRRWQQILVELGSSNINFSTEASAALLNMLALQAGPTNFDDALGVVHSVARDGKFCQRLLEQLGHRLDGISFNWRETNSMDMIITLALWLFELSADIRLEATELLLKVRSIAIQWMSALRSDLRQSMDAASLRNCSRYLFWAALLCRRTFKIYEGGRIALNSKALTDYIHCSINLQDNLVAEPASLPTVLKNALMRDFKMAFNLRDSLKISIMANQVCLPSAIASIWPEVEGQQPRQFSDVVFLPEPNEWWVQMIVAETFFSCQQIVHFHILEGHLLVDGKPIGKLPPEWRQHLVLQQLFGNQRLQTFPSSMPGMSYMLAAPVYNHEIHIGFRDKQLIVRALYQGRLLELIPGSIFGTSTNFDIPASLVENCVHWLHLKTGIVEIRQEPHIWRSKESDWQLNVNGRFAIRRNAGKTSRLVDTQSPLFYRVAQTFDNFEERRYLTVFQPEMGRLTVELRRLALSFSVNSRNLLESPQLKAEVDINQDAGAWYGLLSKLVLKEVVIRHDPITRYITSEPQSQRIVLVPMGGIKYARSGPHVAVQVENNGLYGRYIINDVLGRLECPAEPRLLYTKAQYHAYTSSFMQDPLTGRTGSEEALHCLRSAYCQPWTPITAGPYQALSFISNLAPLREYYPKELKKMQTTTWNPHLTTAIQHDGYRIIVDQILAKSEELSSFSLEKIELPPLQAKSDDHLTVRSLIRRQSYERPDCWLDVGSAHDLEYQSRDRWKVSQSRLNVLECVHLLRTWPASFPTTVDLAGILQGWTTIGGYSGHFEKILLSDILDAQIGLEWGSLVNLCRDSDSSYAFKLMFLFACLSFRKDVNTDALKVLIAFAIFSDLKTLTPPGWPVFSQFRQNQPPRVAYLVTLMTPCLTPYPGDDRSTFAFNLSHKQRRRFEALETAHETKREADAQLIAEHLLKQWPCAIPDLEGFSTSVLVDMQQALDIIRPDWLRLFQNAELSQYISSAQAVLNVHHSDLTQPSVELVGDHVEAPLFPIRTRGCKFPSLQELLCQAVAGNTSKPIVSRSAKPVTLPLQERHNSSDPRAIRSKAPQSILPKFPPEIMELDKIIKMASGSNSAVQQQYADDLVQSLKALRKFITLNPPQQQPLTTLMHLSSRISQAELTTNVILKTLKRSFEVEHDYAARWLQMGGLWPATSPTALLENLRSTSTVRFGSGMRETLIDYAVAITVLQRAHRMNDAYQKSNNQRLSEEQNNRGHTNWKPSDCPDWLLLEIDSNILIRPSQIDVAMATISPASKSNSVLQMNMGQGKTSCIIPMAAAVLADGTNLLRIVVPKPLLLQTAQLLQGRLGGLIGRELRHVPFSRKTPTKSSIIELFLKTHKEMQKSNGIMLALPEHILSFMLSGLQRLSDGKTLEASSMIKVQNWISQRSRDVLDECDNILALRTQLIYPSGSQKTVAGHPHRWEVAEALLRQINGHLHNLQRAYPRSIEVIPRGHGGFPVLFFLRKDVEDELIRRLVDDVYHGRTSILPADSKEQRTCIKQFISQAQVDPEVSQSINTMFPEKPAFRRVVYLLRGLLVHRILLMTLKKRWNVQYGLHPNRDPIAVPYHAKGTPSDQAEWGHPDVAILFTCLAFYYDGLHLSHLRQALEHVLKSDDPSQVYDRFVYDTQLSDSLKEWSAINVDDDAQLKEVWQHLRYSVVVVDYFLNNFVFPKHAKQFQVKLQASGWDIPLFNNHQGQELTSASSPRHPLTTGFSGTNDWKRMLPLTIDQHDLNGLSHTNAEVLTYLLQLRNRKYIVAADSKDRHVSEHELLGMITKERIRVLIDAGAQILEMDNLSLVKAWLDIYEDAPAAVFFDKVNRPTVLYRQGHQVPLLATPFADDLSSVLVYLDQAHTRGTDLKMPSDARGALTLGLDLTKDATVQAAMRLRQLGSTQSITFFAPPEVHHSILDLRKKSTSAKLDSSDVICWLIEQTCNGIEQLQPLHFSQGVDFCRRTQAISDNPGYLVDEDERQSCLQSLRQVEQQTLEQLYGTNTKSKVTTISENQSPIIAEFMKELKQRRKGFKDTGNAVHGSALQEVEQEREVAYEVETVREVQKPVHYKPYGFPGLHRDILSFATTGRMAADSSAFMQAFASIKMFGLGQKHPINLDATSTRLYVSQEFTRTVNVPSTRIYDQFQRPVNWILWSPGHETAIIVIPEEVELLLPIVQSSQSRATHLLTYAAPITRKMLHFNDLKYYSVPELPADWEAPMWLRTELGIFAGRLYFEYHEYPHVLEFLGVKDQSGKLEEAEIDGVADGEEVNIDASLGNIPTAIVERKAFTRRPLAFMAEWLNIRRKGQDISETPIGFICAGKQLLESHPFFLRAEYEHTRKEISTLKTGSGHVNDEDEDEAKEMCVDNVYEDVYREEDTFDDAELQEVGEMKAEE